MKEGISLWEALEGFGHAKVAARLNNQTWALDRCALGLGRLCGLQLETAHLPIADYHILLRPLKKRACALKLRACLRKKTQCIILCFILKCPCDVYDIRSLHGRLGSAE